MTALLSPVTCFGMARKEKTERTQQANFRLRTTTMERMERYKDRHILHPTLTQIVESAVNRWLNEEEPKLDTDGMGRSPKR